VQSTISTALLLLALSGCESTASASSTTDPTPASDSTPATSTLNVEIQGLRSSKGGLIAYLYDSEDAFPKEFDRAVQEKRRPSLVGTSTALRFTDLAPGTYALLVIHDENSNGEMDKNLIGLPKEGVGASKVEKGRPQWSSAKFTVDEHRNVTVFIQYFL